MKIRYTKCLPNGRQEFVNYPINEAIQLGFQFTKDDCKFTICEHDKFTILKMQKQIANSLCHPLNGDMANEFNDGFIEW